MELELNRTHMTGYETVLDTTVFQEETLETIVPDACPDILRLVDTQGSIFLKNKLATDGRVTLTGTARLTVLYQPDGGTGPCHLDVGIPLQIAIEDSKIRSGCVISVIPRVVGADTRTINPRKILTRVEIAAQVKVLTSTSVALCAGIGAKDGTVEQLMESYRISCISAVQEKQISFEDDLSIPAGRPAANELVSSRVNTICRDTRIIGNKLILKGESIVQILYRSVEGELDAVDFTLPFSQIMEVTGVGEDAVADVDMCLSNADFRLNEDGRMISASLSMIAQTIVREERSVMLLADTYSTCCAMRTESVPFEYRVRQTEGVGRQMVRETIETGVQVKSVVDSYCMIGRVSHQREGSDLRLNIQTETVVLCISEEGEYFAVSRGFDVVCSIEVPEGCGCQYYCRVENMTASPIADGVEVRFPLDVPYLCLQDSCAILVRDATIIAEEENKDRGKPSIVLRLLEDGERLWDVAKRYRTTISDIVKANELDSEQPECGTLLLIPRKR